MSTNKVVAKGENSQAAGRDINNNILLHSSYIFNPQDLADLIDIIFDKSETDSSQIYDFNILEIEEKNKKNNISEEFYEECIKEDLGYFVEIDRFLKNPKNKKHKDKFFGIIKTLKPKIITALDNGEKMQDVLSKLFDYFFETKQTCATGKEFLATTLAYYMYHSCYIGRK